MLVHKPSSTLVVLALAVATLALAMMPACKSANSQTRSLNVPLAFTPKWAASRPYPAITYSPALKLHIAPVVDARPEKEQVGENVEKMKTMGARPIYADGMTAPEFVQDAFSRELASLGYTQVPTAGEANRILNITLNRFYTVESNNYQAEVRVSCEVRTDGGQVLWQGQSVGNAKNFGRSLSVENYNQTFSDATIRALAELLKDPRFQTAITVK